MNAVRRADGLLSAKHTVALLDLLQDGDRQERVIIADLVALQSVSRSRAQNTLALLRKLGILVEAKGVISIRDRAVGADGWFRPVQEVVAAELADRIASGSINCLQTSSAQDGLWLDSLLLPGTEDGLPLWVVEFSVATRGRTGDRFWRLSSSYRQLFLDGARESNKKLVRRLMTAAQLEKKLDDDAIHGRAAEEWVVEYERRRLAGHPLVDQIRRISDENVAAGYDIVSFSETAVLHHDLFIEVKSHAGQRRFFWSRTEMATAEKLGEEYSLYLVDRGKFGVADYAPQVIRGPYSALVQSTDSGWSISPTTFECVPVV